jgi:hypothetical protein
MAIGTEGALARSNLNDLTPGLGPLRDQDGFLSRLQRETLGWMPTPGSKLQGFRRYAASDHRPSDPLASQERHRSIGQPLFASIRSLSRRRPGGSGSIRGDSLFVFIRGLF